MAEKKKIYKIVSYKFKNGYSARWLNRRISTFKLNDKKSYGIKIERAFTKEELKEDGVELKPENISLLTISKNSKSTLEFMLSEQAMIALYKLIEITLKRTSLEENSNKDNE